MIKLMKIMLCTLCILGMTGCNYNNLDKSEPISKTEILMGTAITISIYDTKDEKILDKAFDRIREIEKLTSINIENTEIDKINKNAGKKVKVSDDTYKIIKSGHEYSKLSQGSYDISIGPLVDIWNIGDENAKVPSEEEINKALSYINYKDIELNYETKEVMLKNENMKIDLGSIAKGYAADEVVKLLKSEKIERAIIDLGGNVYALGEKEENQKWTIGIQDPFKERGNVVGSLDISNQAVVTSGIYERFLEVDGQKYHHILNPKTGYPYETDIEGVSIIADNAIDADAISTLVFTKGLKQGMEFIEGKDGVEAIFIGTDKKVYISSGIKGNFSIMNTEYKLQEIDK